MSFLRKLVVQSPVHYIIAVVLSALVAILRFVTLPEGTPTYFALYEVLSVAGCVTFLIGGLLAVAYYGAFDFFSYAFSSSRFGKGKKYDSYADYHQTKAEKRSREAYYFVPYFLVGMVVFLISFLFG